MPTYKPKDKMPKLPTKTQIDRLISGSGEVTSLKLWMMKETGFRPVEIQDLAVKDIDTERSAINATTHKDGIGRTIKVTKALTDAILGYIDKRNLTPTNKLFSGDSKYFGKQYRANRKRLAQRFRDPSLLTVRLYDFRHYFITMQYIKLRDLPLTANDAGHRDYNTTRKYLHLARIIEMLETDDQWTCKIAQNDEEEVQLNENGFQYVRTREDGKPIYRKRK
jgi:integrase